MQRPCCVPQLAAVPGARSLTDSPQRRSAASGFIFGLLSTKIWRFIELVTAVERAVIPLYSLFCANLITTRYPGSITTALTRGWPFCLAAYWPPNIPRCADELWGRMCHLAADPFKICLSCLCSPHSAFHLTPSISGCALLHLENRLPFHLLSQ